MTTPNLKVGLTTGIDAFGDAGKVSTPEWIAPPTLDKAFADKLRAANQTPDSSPSATSLALEVYSSGLLDTLGACNSEICKKTDIGITGGYQFGGIGAGKVALFGQYPVYTSGSNSVVIRAQAGGRIYGARVFSPRDVDNVDISGFKFDASVMAGAETAILGVPVTLMLGGQAGPGADLGHGFRAEGGPSFVANVSVSLDGIVRRIASPKEEEAPPKPAVTDPCQEAADAMKLGPKSLDNAVAKCTDSPFPVFDKMAKLLMAYDFSNGSLKEYNTYLKQFAEGIVANNKLKNAEINDLVGKLQSAWQRTEAVASADMADSPYLNLIKLTNELQKLIDSGRITLDRVAELYDVAIAGAGKRSPIEGANARLNVLIAFYMRVLNKETPAAIGSSFRPRADKILADLLDGAQKDIPEKVPAIINGLIDKNGTYSSTLLQPHKDRFVAAAKASGDAAAMKSVADFYGIVAAPAKKGKKPKKHK